MKTKKFIFIMVTILLSVGGAFIGIKYKTYQSLKSEIDVTVEHFNNGEYRYEYNNQIPEELREENEQVQNDILSYILINTDIKTDISLLNTEVKFYFNGPDMESYLNDEDILTYKSEEELKNALLEFAKKGGKKERVVTIKYSKVNDKWIGDSYKPEVLDAMFGGIFSGYQTLYGKMLDELKENIEG